MGARIIEYRCAAVPHIHGEIVHLAGDEKVITSARLVNIKAQTLAVGMPTAVTLMNRAELVTAIRVLQKILDKLEGNIEEVETLGDIVS